MASTRRLQGGRVLIVVHGYPPTYTGEAERRAQRTAQVLRHEGCDVRVLCIEALRSRGNGVSWEDRIDDSILVRRLTINPSVAEVPFRWSYHNPGVACALRGFIQGWQPDLVHLFSGYLTSASVIREARAADVPVIVSLTDYWWQCHRLNLIKTDSSTCDGPSAAACARCQAETFRRFRLPASVLPNATTMAWQVAARSDRLRKMFGITEQERRQEIVTTALESTGALIAPSQYLASVYVRHGADPRKLHVSRQGVQSERRQLHRPSPVLRFGFIGQIKPHKSPDLLLRAWERLTGERARTLRLYGSDRDSEGYGALIRRLLTRLPDAEWTGEIEHDTVWSALAELDALVFPSRWVENSPNSILEAQAAGGPVVAADMGAMPELVHHERDGLLFPTDDVDGLAATLQRLLDDSSLVDRLSRSAPKVRSIDDEVDDLIALYTSVWRERAQAEQKTPF